MRVAAIGLLFLVATHPLSAAFSVASTTSGIVLLEACNDGMRTGRMPVVVKGADTADVTVSASLSLSGARGGVTLRDSTVKERETMVLELEFWIAGCRPPSSGILLLRGATDAITFNVTFKPNVAACASGWSGWKDMTLCGPLVLSVIILIVCLVQVRMNLTARMGAAQWDFSSWASNVTLGSGLLGSILGYSLFPDTGTYLNKSDYMGASIAFSLLAALAPQTYNIFRKLSVDPNHPTGTQSQGFVISFVFAAGLTSWAAIGQTALTALATAGLQCAGYLDPCLARPLVCLLVVLSLGLTVYVVTSVKFTVDQRGAVPPLTAMAASGKPLPIPNWHVL